MYYAHTRELEISNWQSLREHLVNSAILARDIGHDAGVSEFAYLAALLHDIGKYSQKFQDRLYGRGARVDHSTAGAKEAINIFRTTPQPIIGTLLAYCIAGHHTGLPDYGSVIDTGVEGTLQARLKKNVHDFSNYQTEININDLTLPQAIPICRTTDTGEFSLAFFTRMVYSVLVDADYLDTEAFMAETKYVREKLVSIDELCNTFENYLKKFEKPANKIQAKRTETLHTCLEKASGRQGLYKLTVPTGGGKTFSSMAFALRHARINGLKRILYVIPFTSIIDQNAAEFKKILGESNVLEHHSNFDWERLGKVMTTEDDDDRTNKMVEKLKLASENWDIPIIMTTNVQFFESLFANHSSACRKLHNIAGSVIIFDEAQMLPKQYLKPCLLAIYELVKNYRATAVFCTATQPPIERFLPSEASIVELAQNPNGLYQFFKRVEIVQCGKMTDIEIAEKLREVNQGMCIVNTRKHARGIFNLIGGEGCFHLSTLMCPAHRKKTIDEIRNRLSTDNSCRVVSTQIIEAGIDLDFPEGYRAMAGLDAILQAAGRVNREGKRGKGRLYIFEPDTELIKRTPSYIEQGADITRIILREYSDPTSLEAISCYYRRLFDLQGKHTIDIHRIVECFEKGIGEPCFDFTTAADKFRLIDNQTTSVIIPYDAKANGILQQVRKSDTPRKFSRLLQQYAVNIYENEYQALMDAGMIEIDNYGGVYAVLKNRNNYDDLTGLILPEGGGEAIFYDG